MTTLPGLTISVTETPTYLSEREGRYIRALIHRFMRMTQSQFALSIQMDRSQLSGYLCGNRPVDATVLKRILNGIHFDHQDLHFTYEPKWETNIVIRPYATGPAVQRVDSIQQDAQ